MTDACATIVTAEDEAPRRLGGELENGLESLEKRTANVPGCTTLRRAADAVARKLRYEEGDLFGELWDDVTPAACILGSATCACKFSCPRSLT